MASGEPVDITRLNSTKDALTNFREVLTLLRDLLIWKKEWFSAVIVGVLTVFYMFIWWNEVTVLTTVSVLAMALVGLDMACAHGRKFIQNFVPWTTQREREFTDICLWISHGGSSMANFRDIMAAYRESNPLIYYTGTSTALLVTAWLGNSISNLLLCYWITLGFALAPGLTQSGLVAKYSAPFYPTIRDMVAKYFPKKKPTDAPKED